uniref:Uncharacterized protein n=1 Tax=Molossus molossus TaxID=27622 RepID=A0A7J8BYH3_MOLMO|nr:hypothetical protein HJG59_010042 [Molossus molossus]
MRPRAQAFPSQLSTWQLSNESAWPSVTNSDEQLVLINEEGELLGWCFGGFMDEVVLFHCLLTTDVSNRLRSLAKAWLRAGGGCTGSEGAPSLPIPSSLQSSVYKLLKPPPDPSDFVHINPEKSRQRIPVPLLSKNLWN